LEKRKIMPKSKDEFECLLSIPNLGQYVGKWIAIVDDKVVSTGNAGKEVLKEARSKYPERTPLIMKVPSHTVMLL
jgi:orotate phosphoribosyltransferase-like protein